MNKCSIIGFALVLSMLLCACSNVTPQLEPALTPIPTATVDPASPTPESTALPWGSDDGKDALGNSILGSDHYRRYVQFENVRVYEAHDGTFLDCYVVNSYPETLTCAVKVVFKDENGELLAEANLQNPDGSFLLTLENGRTPLYATILTDTVLTDKEFELIFDESVPVAPIGTVG